MKIKKLKKQLLRQQIMLTQNKRTTEHRLQSIVDDVQTTAIRFLNNFASDKLSDDTEKDDAEKPNDSVVENVSIIEVNGVPVKFLMVGGAKYMCIADFKSVAEGLRNDVTSDVLKNNLIEALEFLIKTE